MKTTHGYEFTYMRNAPCKLKDKMWIINHDYLLEYDVESSDLHIPWKLCFLHNLFFLNGILGI